MSTRTVNTTLFLLVTVQLLSGFGSFLVGSPSGRAVTWVHLACGLTLAVLLFWKGRVILRSLRRHGLGAWAVPSLALLALLVVVMVTGLAWSSVGFPHIAGYPAMTVHVVAALLMLPLFVPHVRARWPRPSLRDAIGRRVLLRRGLLLGAGTGVWLGMEGGVRALGLSGANRRFTGSRPVASAAPLDFPETSWLFDAPSPYARSGWSVRLHGAVERPVDLPLTELTALDTRETTLDCTGGWYARRTWSGVTIGRMLDEAGLQRSARSIVVRSATGYWRRLPLAEARAAMLATHVDGEPLDHGHGAPVRLVAPGRRGYEWVKWVVEVEVSRAHPLLKWPLPLQ